MLITRNLNSYNTFTVLHNLQITTAHSKSFQSTLSWHTHCLVAASSSGNSLYHFCVQQRLSLITNDWRLTTDISPDWLLNCCWPSPAQWFLVPRPTGLRTMFYCLMFLGAFRAVWSHRSFLYNFLMDCIDTTASSSPSIFVYLLPQEHVYQTVA
jgi:hypothetical protein